MIARSALSITFHDILERVGLALPHRRTSIPRGILRDRWRRIFAGFEILSRDRPERFLHFCQSCGEDTPHEGFDELGPGWYAQICRCRHCGGQGMRVWPLIWW
jgi:hypothetical protein